MKKQLLDLGYRLINEDKADFVFINSCTVKSPTEKQDFQKTIKESKLSVNNINMYWKRLETKAHKLKQLPNLMRKEKTITNGKIEQKLY